MTVKYYYDIESLDNVFSNAVYKHHTDPLKTSIDLYYLIDNEDEIITASTFEEDATKIIKERNKEFKGTINFLNLKDINSNLKMAKTFGVSDKKSIQDEDSWNNKLAIVDTTDENYNEKTDPYILGYNSYNYDSTILATYFEETLQTSQVIQDKQTKTSLKFTPTTAKLMREYNDAMFSKDFKKSMPTFLKYSYENGLLNMKAPKNDLRKNLIRMNMLKSGRHIDVAKLAETQSKVALKRILGMLGYQILESDKLQHSSTIETYEELLELLAYNVSDIINLKNLSEHVVYQSNFDLKKLLLETYPELIYREKDNTYTPDVNKLSVRPYRLRIDSTSAQFTATVLYPYSHIEDFPTVSYMYPSKEKAEELGIKQINVLEYMKERFYEWFPQKELRENFDNIYNYYKSIEGKNFNDTGSYQDQKNVKEYIDNIKMQVANKVKEKYSDKSTQTRQKAEEKLTELYLTKIGIIEPYNLKNIPTPNLNLPYYTKEGKLTSCFVNFSTGGIHGAEFNLSLYNYHMNEYEELKNNMSIIKTYYPNALDFKKAAVKVPIIYKGQPVSNKEVVYISHEGKEYEFNVKTYLTTKSTKKNAEYKDIEPLKPELFKKKAKTKNGVETTSYSLNDKYKFTSICLTWHNDFSSYYPNLLIMLNAFFNKKLGSDRYLSIYQDKERLGKEAKNPNLSDHERAILLLQREGTKLVLNAGTGAGDSKHDNNLKAPNKIISMRIIGQMFSYMVGQIQTIHGARVVSTNTDGLYSAEIPKDANDNVLESESKLINIPIEPEPMFLVSKDSNNRIEYALESSIDDITKIDLKCKDHYKVGKILAAGGGSLSAYKGPNPRKSLSHPAILDYTLAQYFKYILETDIDLINKPMDKQVAKEIMLDVFNKQPIEDVLMLYQHIVASSNGSNTYIFATNPRELNISELSGIELEPMFNPNLKYEKLQHYNRIFYVKDNTPNTKNLMQATTATIDKNTIAKRLDNDEIIQQHVGLAKCVLEDNGVTEIENNKEAALKKVTGVEPTWEVLIVNKSLFELDEDEIKTLKDQIDYDKYVNLLATSYENNWLNITPEFEKQQIELKEQASLEKKYQTYMNKLKEKERKQRFKKFTKTKSYYKKHRPKKYPRIRQREELKWETLKVKLSHIS